MKTAPLGQRNTDQKALRLEGDSQPPTPLGHGAVLKYWEVTNVNARKPQTTGASAAYVGAKIWSLDCVKVLLPLPARCSGLALTCILSQLGKAI